MFSFAAAEEVSVKAYADIIHGFALPLIWVAMMQSDLWSKARIRGTILLIYR